jgi:hypothetical protein
MTKLRINNTTVFVTVLGACLGLVVAGASSPAHQTAASVLSEIASATSANLSYRHSSNQALQLTAVYHAAALPFALDSEKGAATVLYQNTNPSVPGRRILVVTRLARASLDGIPA